MTWRTVGPAGRGLRMQEQGEDAEEAGGAPWEAAMGFDADPRLGEAVGALLEPRGEAATAQHAADQPRGLPEAPSALDGRAGVGGLGDQYLEAQSGIAE